MLDSLLQVRYNNKRKTLVDFSGFNHLFATQLSCDSLSLIKTCRSVRAYKSESVPSKASDSVLEAGTYPAQEAGQPAARKQNYIVRTICGEEGTHADQ